MLTIDVTDDPRFVRLSGELTFTDHGRFRDVARRLIDGTGNPLIIDCGDLTFIDSAGLGMLLLLREEAATTNRAVVLRNAQHQVKRMFAISRFDALFSVEPAAA